MNELDRDILKEIFKETNSHLRVTERKSLIVTGAYIGLFSVFLSTLAKSSWGIDINSISWVHVFTKVFFLAIGICVFIMQEWYRAWKEHYINVCIAIRKELLSPDINKEIFPYWLRSSYHESRFSIDNILKYLTSAINFALVFIISYEILHLVDNQKLGILIVVLLFMSFIATIYMVDKLIINSKLLIA